MVKIYIVAESGYEHTRVIRAYTTREAAEGLIQELSDYVAKKPRPTTVIEYRDQDHELTKAYYAALREWRYNSPTGPDYVWNGGPNDDLEIIELDFYEEAAE